VKSGPASWRPERRVLRRLTVALSGVILLAAGCGDTDTAIARGDRFWADSNYTAALAEYRLSLGQGREDDQVLARVAHAYFETGQLERAKEYYDQLTRQSPEYIDQAVFDYVTYARRAQDKSDRYGMAGGVEPALALRPGLPLDDLAGTLARYYASTGDPDRSLSFFERALSVAPTDSVPTLLYELAQVHESRGNCEEAIGFFNAYRNRAPQGERIGEARWHVGNCAFTLARKAHQGGHLGEALRQVDTVLEIGEPQNLLDQAWFERGEILLSLGRRDDALFAFIMVLELNRARTGQLVERAQRRIDELRFGGR
jgi:tetratricopeptide (TPR) repeat protein